MIGIQAALPEALKLAKRGSFFGVDIDISEISRIVERSYPGDVKELF